MLIVGWFWLSCLVMCVMLCMLYRRLKSCSSFRLGRLVGIGILLFIVMVLLYLLYCWYEW